MPWCHTAFYQPTVKFKKVSKRFLILIHNRFTMWIKNKLEGMIDAV